MDKARAKRSEQSAKLQAKLHDLFQQGLRPADIDPQQIRNELELPSLSKTTIKHYFQRWQHGLETPVLSAGLTETKSNKLLGLSAGQMEANSKEAVMITEEREERIRAKERARVLREQEEKARQENLDKTLNSLSSGLGELRNGLSQLRTASEAIEQRLAATSEEINALKAEAKPIDLEPIREELAGIKAMIPENFCEKFPDMCNILEHPPAAKGPVHETAKEFLECPECFPSFAEAILEHTELRKRLAENLGEAEYDIIIERLKVAGYDVEKLEEAKAREF